jgi:hypothetical protein
VARNPALDLEKLVSVDGGTSFEDADTPTGPEVAEAGADIVFKFEVENTGNVTLTNVVVTDSDFDLDGLAGDTVADDGGYTIASLGVGQTVEFTFDAQWEAGQHINTAVATSDQEVGDSDLAHYFGLIDEGPGVRTPGFWSNLGFKFWDGIVGNEPKQAGTPGFADGELLYPVDSDGDGDTELGLLVGDYDMDGVTDADEDTFFINLADAQKLINASQKQQQDTRWVLGRDVVATWLNYLAGNAIGDGSEDSAQFYIDEAVDWLSLTADSNDDDIFDLGGPAVKASSAAWQSGLDSGDFNPDLDVLAGKTIHSALDEYNNFGTVNGVINAHDADSSAFVLALSIATAPSTDLLLQ